MIPFQTTPQEVLRLATIVTEMGAAGLDESFIVEAFKLAQTDQGVFDLMALWQDAAADAAERDEIIAELQESLDDYREAPAAPEKRPYIRYDDLGRVAGDIVEFKKRLRELIDRHGGVSAIAAKSGIPQPSLSRMLGSASIPRRATLYKIANALDLPETEIATEWSR